MSAGHLPLVVVSHSLPSEWLSRLEGQAQLFVGPETRQPSGLAPELFEPLAQAQGLFTLLTVRVDETLLARAPYLKVVSNMAVGVDNIDLPACTRRGIPVGNTPGVLTEGTADLVMALLLASARRLPESSLDARQGRWTTWNPTGWLGADLSDATLGIIGMGKIGKAVARRAIGFGLRLVYTDPQPQPQIEAEFQAARLDLESLLAASDFVSLNLPLTAETRHTIDAAALRRMKPTAVLINAARGPVVDTQALLQALQQGWISGAALDVTDPEPLPPDHPLYQLPNCLIVPHIGSATRLTRRRMAELACDNLLAGLAGERLPHCANPQVYRE
jgi:lactate dehydrogenase-like 2-hydroxyacid dehydrogenase